MNGEKNTKKTIFENVLKYQQVPVVLVTVLCLAGIFCFINIPKQEFPQFTVLEGLVIAAYPGASSEQVDARLAKPLQNYLFSYSQVDRKKTYSVSKENQCVVFLFINPGVDPDTFWPKLRIGLQEFKTSLPAQLVLLEALSDFGDSSTVLLSISSDKRSYRELETYLNGLSDLIRTYKKVSNIQTFGLQKEEISVYIDERKLAYYGINPSLLMADLQMATLEGYGATINQHDLKLPVRLPGEFKDEVDLANQIIVITPSGDIVRLKDIADIKREYTVDASFVETNGEAAVGLSITMAGGNNVMQFGTQIDKYITQFKAVLPNGVKITTIADQPAVVTTSILHFFRDFGIAILSVIIVIIFFLPRRIATVAAVTIPVSILIAISVLQICGVELNTVSLAALVLVLGMVVDNSIVIIDNHVEKLDGGVPVREAAWKSAKELFVPITTATFAIIAAFVPTIFFLTGMFKEFIAPAPVTVAITLFVSFFIAVLFVPILNYRFIKTGVRQHQDETKPQKKTLLDRLQEFYNNTFLASAFKKPARTIGIGLACIVLGGGLFAFLPQQLFPKLEHSNFAVELYFPEGTSLDANTKVTKEVAAALMKDKRVVNVVSFVGSSSPRFSALYAPQIPALNYSQLIVNTYTDTQTVRVLEEFDAKYRDLYPQAHIRWKQLDFLPNDAPIEVQISGDDIQTIKSFAEDVKNSMRPEHDLIWIKDDYRNPLLAVNLNINSESANRLGISKALLGLSTAISHSNVPLATVWDGDYAKTVYLKNKQSDDNSANDLLGQYVLSPDNIRPIMVEDIATIEPGFTEGQIVRRNGRYAITVSADAAFGKLVDPIFKRVSKKINALPKPEGVSIFYDGQHEMEMETYFPFALSLATSVVIIFLLMLFQFKNIRHALLVMSTMPLAIIGAVLGLFIIGYPFGMTSFMGLIGLFGIVIRNGVILVSYANELRDTGMSLKEAAIAAGERRMRPIFLTAAAAAVGVIPLMTSGSLLWGPLGSVICFGLIGSTILTLYVLPLAYWKFGGKDHEE